MLTDRTWVQRQCILQQLNISNFRQFIKECEQSIMCLWWMDGWWMDVPDLCDVWPSWSGLLILRPIVNVMALHDILIAFCIISELRRWNYTTPWTMWDLQWPRPCPRSCPASPTIHCHTSTFPPLSLATSLSRRGSPCCIRLRRILLYSSSSVSRYLTENCK